MRHDKLRTAAIAAAAVALLAAGTAAAQDAPAKRTEGRYFVQLSEVLLSSDDFDLAIGTFDEGGPGAGAPVERVDAILSDDTWAAPSVTIGLNRPSGKTTVSLGFLNFDLSDSRTRQDIKVAENVATSALLPPGIVFTRQEPGEPDPNGRPGPPNWANELVFEHGADFKMVDFKVERNFFENERFRLRWMAGLRYAQLRQGLTHAASFAPEEGSLLGREFDVQDFFLLRSLVSTHGFGPQLGLGARVLLDPKKRWSIEGGLDVALIPESARVTYAVQMVDNFIPDPSSITPGQPIRRSDSPLIPGLARGGAPFAAELEYGSYTQATWMAQGRLGFRFKPKSFFAIGLDVWQLRWNEVLSQFGVLEDIHELATYEQFIPTGSPLPADPQLRDAESVIHVPRFARRDTFTFEGASLNLVFDF